MLTAAESQAAEIFGPLWAALCRADSSRPTSYHHFPGVYNSAWLATLPLPIDEAMPPEQAVAFLEKGRQGRLEEYLGANAPKSI